MTYHARVTNGDEVALPVALARELAIEDGDSLVVEHGSGGLVIKTYRQVVKEAQAKVKAMTPAGGPSIVDELIADRRAEAERESAEMEAWMRANRG